MTLVWFLSLLNFDTLAQPIILEFFSFFGSGMPFLLVSICLFGHPSKISSDYLSIPVVGQAQVRLELGPSGVK